MTEVFCGSIECKHNKDSVCKAKKLSMISSNVMTVHQGRKDFWECNMFEESEEYKIIKQMVGRDYDL